MSHLNQYLSLHLHVNQRGFESAIGFTQQSRKVLESPLVKTTYSGVNSIESTILLRIDKENICTKHSVERAGRSVENGLEILKHLLCLRAYVIGHEFAANIAADLTGCVDYVLEDFGMIWSGMLAGLAREIV